MGVLTVVLGLGLVFGSVVTTLGAQSASAHRSNAEQKFRAGDLDGAIADLTKAITLDPKHAETFTQRGFMRMQQVDIRGAIADFTEAILLDPQTPGNYAFRGAMKHHAGDLDGAIADEQKALLLDPRLFLAHRTLMLVYFDKAYTGTLLSPAEKREAIARGSEAADQALLVAGESVEGLTYKGLFLRLQASLETDPARQKALIQQAEAFRDKAQQLMRQGKGPESYGIPPRPTRAPSPEPPPPPTATVRVGGDIAAPQKLVHVEPVYPSIAISARVRGVVIVEATVDGRGNVTDATILRSIPLLDQAALDAVRQWKFAPTLLNGVPVPVVMTVTVTFSLQ